MPVHVHSTVAYTSIILAIYLDNERDTLHISSQKHNISIRYFTWTRHLQHRCDSCVYSLVFRVCALSPSPARWASLLRRRASPELPPRLRRSWFSVCASPGPSRFCRPCSLILWSKETHRFCHVLPVSSMFDISALNRTGRSASSHPRCASVAQWAPWHPDALWHNLLGHKVTDCTV